jgi:hypothetical protein
MYQNLGRGQLYLKTLPAQRPTNNINGPSRSIAVLAVILFALAGLMSGFAVGGFIHSKSGLSSTTGTSGTTSEGQTTKSSSPPSHPVRLGFPQMNLSNDIQKADGTTYTLTTQAINSQSQPVHASGITCKLWLVRRIPEGTILDIPISILKDVNAISNPIPGTVNGLSFNEVDGLNFDNSTPQTHLCNANGQFTWKYQLSSAVASGAYNLVVLTDWQGAYYNWAWINIVIQ